MNDYSDWCYECRSLGDDYHYDDNGDLISNCESCWVYHERQRIMEASDHDWQ